MAERIIRENRRAFKGVWIPAEFWLDQNLSIIEVIVLTEIDSLDNENGCVASNKHFAEFTGLSKNRVSEIVNGLKTKGYVNIQYFFDDYGQKRRTMRLNQLVRKNDIGIRNSEGGIRDIEGGYSENRDCRNTVKNTARNPNIGIQSSSSAYSTNSEYVSSLAADDDARRTQPGQALDQSVATAAPAQPQQPAVQPQRPQRQPQPSSWTEPADPNGVNRIFKIWADLWSRPSSTTIADLTAWVKEFGPEVVLYALKKAATADASRPHAYMAAIIRGYRNAGVKTLDDVKAAEQARDQRNQQSYGRQQYGRGGNVQEQLPDWAKNGPKKNSSTDSQKSKQLSAQLDAQMAGFELYKRLRSAVDLAQTLDDSDVQAIRDNLVQPNGYGNLSVDAPKLFERYCQQHNLQFCSQKKSAETAD